MGTCHNVYTGTQCSLYAVRLTVHFDPACTLERGAVHLAQFTVILTIFKASNLSAVQSECRQRVSRWDTCNEALQTANWVPFLLSQRLTCG